MKFIIVDDEPIVREGLKTLINWSGMGFTLCDEASDGSEAVAKILKQNPDLVILDIKMPELSGVEVAEAVRKQGYYGKIIILSGFSDFAYAQNAINLGVDAYLLKPVDEEELIAALTKIRDKLEEKNILELYNNQSLQAAKEMLLKHIITGSIPWTGQDGDSYGLALNIRPYQLVMLDYSQDNCINMVEMREYWKKLYLDYKSEFVIIENIIIILIKGNAAIQYFAEHILFYMNKAVQEKIHKPFVVISSTFDEVNSFPEIYQLLKHSCARRFNLEEGNGPIYCKDLDYVKDCSVSDTINPIDFIENIYKGILNKDTSQIEQNIIKLKQVLQKKDFTKEQTFQILINCIVELKTLLRETYIKEFISFNETELINEICSCGTLFDIMQRLRQKFISLCNYVKNPADVDIIEKVLNYLDIHFNEELKLEKIAEIFGYNAAYLGRLLSYRIGTNFSLYIEKKRLDKAIDLLVNTDVKIPDISILIGYQNVEYFYRKFKKYTNFTPGNFRSCHSRKQIGSSGDLINYDEAK